MKKKMVSKSVILAWLSCYLILLMFPMFINIYLFRYLYRSIKDEVIQNNQHVMEYMVQNIERQLMSAEKFCNELYYIPEVAALSKKSNWTTGDVRYEIHKFANQLNETGNFKDTITNFAIYFEKQNKIISGAGVFAPDVYYYAIYGGGKAELEQWNAALTKKSKAVISIGDAENPAIFFMKALSPVGDPKNIIKCIVEIDKNELLQNTLYLSEKRSGAFIMSDNDDNLLLWKGEDGVDMTEEIKSLNDIEGDSCKINGKEYVINKMVSNDKNIKIYYLIDERVLFEKNKKAYNLIIMASILIVLIGSGLIFFFIKGYYSEVKGVLDLYDVKPQKGMNEFELIRNSILSERVEQKKDKAIMGKQRIAVKNYTIMRLLKGVSQNETAKNIFMNLGETPVSERFVVAVMKKSTPGNDEAYMQIAAMVRLSLIYGKDVVVHMDTGSEIAFIINLREYSTERIEEEFMYAEEYIYEHNSLEMIVAISDIYNNIADIAVGYNEAEKLIKSLEVLQKRGVYNVSKSLGNTNSSYYYPMQTEERLMNYIRLGEKDKVANVLDEIYVENFENRVLSIELVNCLMHNIVGTIIKSGTLNSRDGKAEQVTPGQFMKRLNQCSSIDEMKLTIHDMIDQCFAHPPEKHKSKNNTFLEDVIDYVNKNYADENLNVSTVADHFDVTQNSLSKMFSREMNIGLLEYITVFRINKAAQLLLSTDDNISEIAKQVGYSNYRSFTRVFTKQYGVAAKQYRELNRDK